VSDDLSLGSRLTFMGANGSTANLVAGCTSAKVVRSLSDGATLTIEVRDAGKELWRSSVMAATSWVAVDGFHYQLTSVSRSDAGMTLTLDDVVAAKMQTVSGHRKFKAGTTRAAALNHLARNCHVAHAVDPGKDLGALKNDLEVNTVDDPESESFWSATGSIAQEVGWRRFSDGRRMVAGSDAWLLARSPAIRVSSSTRYVDQINADLDFLQKTQTATLAVHMARWAAPPGTGVTLVSEGPASGLWLVDSVERDLTSDRGTITLTRRTRQLPEPKADSTGDSGRDPSVPGDTGTDTGGRSYSAAVDRGLAVALTHRGDRYVYGAKGPHSWDCSGFASAYIRWGGGHISGTAAGLYAACQRAGTTIPVSQAARTRGALLFGIGTGAGASGNHVAISLGNGQTLEARSRKDGVGVFNGGASWSGFNHAALVPGF
jgi:cell wall-associated NlpC family hydrolase